MVNINNRFMKKTKKEKFSISRLLDTLGSLTNSHRRFSFGLLFVCFLCISQSIYAQLINVTGTVTDQSKDPVIGAAVYLVGNAKHGVVTDANGKFSISVPPTGTLHFNVLGMNPVNVKVNNRNVINVVMKGNDRTKLDEVVVSVGYGQMKKRDLTGSVGHADMDEVNQAPVSNLGDALAGRIAGLDISTDDGEPGAESNVTVRGGGLSQDSSPLFIIDGFPIENFNINSLDPRSIESVDVLKDASSIAIYGSRGANGVIIINTKGAQKGKPRVSYSFNLSFNTRPDFVKMMDAYNYVKLQLELDELDGRTTALTKYLGAPDPITGERPKTLDSYKYAPSVDWQKEVTHTGVTQTHNISLSGGSGGTRYIINGGYMDQDALVINTGSTRYTFKGSLEQQLSKKLTLQLNGSTVYNKVRTNSGFSRARSFFPYTGNASVNDYVEEMEQMLADGTLSESGFDYSSLVSPVQQANNEVNQRFQSSSQLGLKLNWNIGKYLMVSPTLQYSTTNTESKQFYNSLTSQGNLFQRANGSYINSKGINANISNSDVKRYLVNLLLNYNRKFGKYHKLNAMIGLDYQYSELTSSSFGVTNIAPAHEYLGFYAMSDGKSKQIYYGGSKNQLASSFARINYTYKDKYLFTATCRIDGSAKFAKGHEWGYFPSAAFAWRFTSEPFLKKLRKVINDGKLRLTYGTVGNNRGVSDFSYLVEFGDLQRNRSYMLDGKTLSSAMVQYFLANPELTWEKTTEFDAGVDLNFFNSRFILSVDFYNKVVDNLLMPRTAPYYLGYANTWNTRYENAGSTLGQGVEISLLSTNIKKGKFMWNTNFNISFIRNKVRHFSRGYEVMGMGLNSGFTPSGDTWLAVTDKSISEFYGYKYVRLYQKSDFYPTTNGFYRLKPGVVSYDAQGGYRVQPGDPMYEDLNGDGTITTADRTTLGSPLPKVYGGMSNTFTYGDFSFNVFFRYSLGGKIVDYTRVMFETTGSFSRYSNQYATYVNRWTETNTNTDIPRLMRPNSRGDVGNTSLPKLSSRLIENGSYLRLSTVTLNYRLPRKIVRKLSLSSVVFNVSAQNLFVLTKYKGQDPEASAYNYASPAKGIGYTALTNSSAYTSMTRGLDHSPYPRAKIFSLGIAVVF
jgi:TonB-linked SusC/RagA family outer membrane protein